MGGINNGIRNIVEIDECWVSGKRVGKNGRIPPTYYYALGIYCRYTKIVNMFVIKNRKFKTIAPFI